MTSATSTSSRRKPHSYSSRSYHAAFAISTLLVSTLNVNAQYPTIDGHPCFRNLEGMTQSMFDLAATYPDLVSIQDIGDSYTKSSGSNNDYNVEGYDIYAMNVTATDELSHASVDKGKKLITSGVHAREYAPPELAMRFAESLVEGYNVDADITWLLRHIEVHFILYVNPDGRYVAENYPDLYWRKNLNSKDCGDDESYGVDINRNFDFMFGAGDGASDDPCESDYHGKDPESEPETRAVVEYAKNLFPADQRKQDPEGDKDEPYGEDIMGMYVDIHSSGGYVYYPWGHVDEFSPDDDALQALGRKIAHFNDYKLWAPGSPDFLYPASGDSSDYMYGALGVGSYGLELGEDFYEDCGLFEDEVMPINMPALMYATKIAKKPFSLVKGPDITSLDITQDEVQDDVMSVTVIASDSLYLDGQHTTGDQGVAQVRVFLNVHPDDYEEGDTVWAIAATKEGGDEQTFELDVMIGVLSGQHTLYAQAMDNDGYFGPVTSIFFDVERVETDPPSNGPTGSPSLRPSRAPTTQPTSAPSSSPSRAPTTAPTSSPTLSPTSQPTTMPSSAPVAADPTSQPTSAPTDAPSNSPTQASAAATSQPTGSPTNEPTAAQSTVEPTNGSTSASKPSPGPTPSPIQAIITADPTEAPVTDEGVEAFPATFDDNASSVAYSSVTVVVASLLVLLHLI